METNDLKLPLSIRQYACHVHPKCAGHVDIRQADGTELLDVPWSHDEIDNARYIVRAVNSHADILAALEECVIAIDGTDAERLGLQCDDTTIANRARAAIKKARGE